MRIKRSRDISSAAIPDLPGVEKKILIGPEDGSFEISMRSFTLAPGSSTPYHSHDFPHVVKIENGKGCFIDAEGSQWDLNPKDVVYVPDKETHGFKNNGSDPFVFICMVPNRGDG